MTCRYLCLEQGVSLSVVRQVPHGAHTVMQDAKNINPCFVHAVINPVTPSMRWWQAIFSAKKHKCKQNGHALGPICHGSVAFLPSRTVTRHFMPTAKRGYLCRKMTRSKTKREGPAKLGQRMHEVHRSLLRSGIADPCIYA
jgi:hypothetical protein